MKISRKALSAAYPKLSSREASRNYDITVEYTWREPVLKLYRVEQINIPFLGGYMPRGTLDYAASSMSPTPPPLLCPSRLLLAGCSIPNDCGQTVETNMVFG